MQQQKPSRDRINAATQGDTLWLLLHTRGAPFKGGPPLKGGPLVCSFAAALERGAAARQVHGGPHARPEAKGPFKWGAPRGGPYNKRGAP